MIFGKRLRQWRESQRPNLSQEEFGAQVDVERGTVTRWENGKTFPSPKTMELIADVTGKSLAWFFTEEDENEVPPVVAQSAAAVSMDPEQLANLIGGAVAKAMTPLRKEMVAEMKRTTSAVKQQTGRVADLARRVASQITKDGALYHQRSERALSANDAAAEGA